MQPNTQQQRSLWLLPAPVHPAADSRAHRRVYLSQHPGALLLAHIHTQQQMQNAQSNSQPPWSWLFGCQAQQLQPLSQLAATDKEAAGGFAQQRPSFAGEHRPADAHDMVCIVDGHACSTSSSRGCHERTNGSSGTTAHGSFCNEVACTALSTEQHNSSSSSNPQMGAGRLANVPDQQGISPQQQQQGQASASSTPTQSAANSSSSSSGAGGGSSTFKQALSGGGPCGSGNPAGLKALGRMLNSEGGKVLGLLGAQLLMHLANLQRGMAALQQHQQGSNSSNSSEQQQQQRPGFWRPRLPWQRQEAAQESAAAASGGGRHSAAWQARQASQQWVVRGTAAEAAMDLREALACYTNAVMLNPGDIDNICRLAKQWSDLTYEPGATVEQIQDVNQRAIEYAERAIMMAPKAAGGYMASCVSRGRLALFSDNKTKVRLAKEAQEAARTALQLEPQNDLAHHLMGRWHFEMAQINFVVRQLIRLVYGAALAPGKFEDALAEFEAAVALNPHKLIHRVELGRTHLRLGHRREAYQQLSLSMSLQVEDVNAQLQKEDAELLLDKLKGEFEGKGSQFDAAVTWGSLSGGEQQQQQGPAGAAGEGRQQQGQQEGK